MDRCLDNYDNILLNNNFGNNNGRGECKCCLCTNTMPINYLRNDLRYYVI